MLLAWLNATLRGKLTEKVKYRLTAAIYKYVVRRGKRSIQIEYVFFAPNH